MKKRSVKPFGSAVGSEPVKKSKFKFQADNSHAVQYENEKALHELAYAPLDEPEMHERRTALRQLQKDIKDNDKLPLRAPLGYDTKWVFSRGSVKCNLMIIGEAPGEQEEKSGQPFVGPSGEELRKQLSAQGLSLDQHAYICNTVCIRPPKNRDPTWQELNSYAEYLRREILIVQPKVILCLGRVSASLISNGFQRLDRLRGEERSYGNALSTLQFETVYKNATNVGAILFPEAKFGARFYTAYHPAFMLRSRELNGPRTFKLEERWTNDFKRVRELLDLPRIDFIDAEEIVRNTCPPDFVFTDNSQPLYVDPNRLHEPSCYTAAGLEMEVRRVQFNVRRNAYDLIGRTADGHSVCVQAMHPTLTFYISHPSIKEGRWTLDFLRAAQLQITQTLLEKVAEYPRYRNNPTAFSDVHIELSLESVRNCINYRPGPKPHLRIDYHAVDLMFPLKGALQAFFETFSDKKIKTLQLNLSALENLCLSKRIYIHGWLRVEDAALKVPDSRISYCELEYVTSTNFLQGFSPNPGEEKDKKWERQAPKRNLSLDGEMLNTGGMFPMPEQDPIVSICAVTNTFDPHDRRAIVQRVRVGVKGKDREHRTTGRSQWDERVIFSVGSTPEIEPEPFDPRLLPNIPVVPREFRITRKDGVVKEATEKTPLEFSAQYGRQLRVWNDFIDKYQKWHTIVGDRRAMMVVRNSKLYAALSELQIRPGGADPKKEWKSLEQVLKWEENCKIVASKAVLVSKKDITQLPCWLDECAGMPEKQAVAEFGELQGYWTAMHPKPRVFSYRSELDMLRGFYKYVREYDPDILSGYNSNNFDLSYFIRRVKALDLRDESGQLLSMSRMRGVDDVDILKSSFSKATGDRVYHTINIEGRDCYDFLNYAMRDYKFQSYTLASVAETLLKDTKNDVPYSAIPSLFRNNRKRLNKYCLKDAELVPMLMIDTNNMNYLVSLCRLIGLMHLERLYVDGKQVQVFSVFLRYLVDEKMHKVMPDRNMYSKEDGDIMEYFLGAHVFDPKTKGLFLKLLLCMDYNSLYPSLMLARNLGHDVGAVASRMLKYGVKLEDCHRTSRQFINPKTRKPEYYYFLQPKKRTREQAEAENLKPEECNIIPSKRAYHGYAKRDDEHTREVRRLLHLQLENLNAEEQPEVVQESARIEPPPGKIEAYVFENEKGARFSLPPDKLTDQHTEQNAIGCIVQISELWSPKNEDAALCGAIRKLLAARKRVKIIMETYLPGSDEYRRLDMIQMALKIICNSAYGATGVKSGKLAGMHISDTVTSEGRKTILGLAAELTVEFNADVQGGDTDSVFVHFPHITELKHIYEKVECTNRQTGEKKVMTRIQEILNFANSLVPDPMKIDFEKAFLRMFAIAKKRAATVTAMPVWDAIENCMVFMDTKGKLDFKGLETKRRDSCLIAQTTVSGFLERIMMGEDTTENNIANAAAFVRSQTELVMSKQVPYHQLIQARQLSKKNYNTKVPHVQLCKKLRRRGEPVPELGSRVPFVVVTGAANRKFADSVENPDYALKKGLMPDYRYVLDKKIAAPIKRFTACMPKGENLDKQMFGGFHVKHKVNLQDDDPLYRYVVKRSPCLNCGALAQSSVCESCTKTVNWHELWQKQQRLLDSEEIEYATRMKRCRTCVGAAETEGVDCVNTSCKEYFPRRQAEYNVEKLQAAVAACIPV